MQIGFIGFGKMGRSMVLRLVNGGHNVIVYNRSIEKLADLKMNGGVTATDIKELTEKLNKPRLIWIMLPAGEPVKTVLDNLLLLLEKGDIVIDGGNSYFRDSIRRAGFLREKGIYFMDAGISGGIWGLDKGFCIMAGGEYEAFKSVEPVFKALSMSEGYQYAGKSGSGHFLKMVHNGIEYGILQAYGEGFELLKATKEFDFDLQNIAKLWNHGSVIRSWILELAELAFNEDANLESVDGYVEDSGEGRWTVTEAIENNIPVPVIAMSLLSRFRSRQDQSFSAKFTSALRNKFGGHKTGRKS